MKIDSILNLAAAFLFPPGPTFWLSKRDGLPKEELINYNSLRVGFFGCSI